MKYFLLGAALLFAPTASAQIIVQTGDDLEAIVKAAPSGSIVEIQSDSTFDVQLKLGDVGFPDSLTLRAGVGFSPVLTSTIAAPIVITLLGKPITLEGLAIVGPPSEPYKSSVDVFAAGTFPTASLITITDCDLDNQLRIAGGSPIELDMTLSGCTLTGDLLVNPTGSGAVKIDMQDCVQDADSFIVNLGGQIAGDFNIQNSTLGAIRDLGGSPTSPFQAVVKDCTITGWVKLDGNSVGSSWQLGRCRIEGELETYSAHTPADYKVSVINSLLIFDGFPNLSAGIKNTTSFGAGPAELEVLNCTVTGFRTGLELEGPTVVRNALVFGSTTADVSLFTPASTVSTSLIGDGTFAGVNGNFTGPVLADTDGSLKPGSAALDAGDNSVPGLGAFDLYGNARIQDNDGDGTATINVGAIESPSPLKGTVTVYNGSGTNPLDFDSNAPVLGTLFHATVAQKPSTLLTVMAIDAPAPAPFQIPAWTGEVLIAATPLLILDFANGHHFVPLPNDPALLGVPISAQGARLELVGITIVTVMLNRLDLVLGI